MNATPHQFDGARDRVLAVALESIDVDTIAGLAGLQSIQRRYSVGAGTALIMQHDLEAFGVAAARAALEMARAQNVDAALDCCCHLAIGSLAEEI